MRAAALACWVANRINRHPETIRLAGTLRLENPSTRPTISRAPGQQHPFAREAEEGVDLPRSLEWRAWHLH